MTELYYKQIVLPLAMAVALLWEGEHTLILSQPLPRERLAAYLGVEPLVLEVVTARPRQPDQRVPQALLS